MLGWKEFELEVVRDRKDNAVIVCSIENLDPMGVHTGDSITVAPAMTLTDKEYQRMRDASIAIMREIGVTTGGSNVQFAVDPKTGRMLVIEMNPRVSRSSALASKATGFPIAKIAAKLAIGYTLDELKNDITRVTPASFEPTIDYVVVKWPRFAFEKFPSANAGARPADEVGRRGDGDRPHVPRGARQGDPLARDRARRLRPADGRARRRPRRRSSARSRSRRRIGCSRSARGFQLGLTVERAHELTRIDPWFLHHVRDDRARRDELVGKTGQRRSAPSCAATSGSGMSDRRIAALTGATEAEVRAARHAAGVRPGLQARRHLRRRVRVAHAVPVLDVRGRVRGAADRRSAR